MVDKDEHSNHLVVNEVEVEGTPEDVWELVASEAGREAWLEPDEDRTIVVESADEGERISWWWWSGDEAPRHVELWVIPNDTQEGDDPATWPDRRAHPARTRVVVFESAPALPLQMLAHASAFALAA